MPVAVLLTVAGVQVPVIPSIDVAGRMGAVAPEQIATAVKVGTKLEPTVTVKLVAIAH